MIESASTMEESHQFIILTEILSWPWVLLTLNDLIILIISKNLQTVLIFQPTSKFVFKPKSIPSWK